MTSPPSPGSAPDSQHPSPLAPLWSAKSIAVVGASDRVGALGRLPVDFLRRYGYRGEVYPVRPDGAPVAGWPSYASVADCPTVELAMIMVGAERVPAAIADCGAAGVPVAIVCASGFAETGPVGAALQAEVVERARAGGVRVVGPNCIGAVGVADGLVASFSPLFSGAKTTLVPGSLAFVSQSGALGYGAVSLAFERGLGLGWVVNTGNESDVTALEVMAELAALPECTGVLGYVEALDDFAALQRLADQGKPVALIKAGGSEAGARAAASHTGALATADRVADAALRQLGIVRCHDVDELLDVGDAFAQPRRPRGSRLAIVTTSGGSGILAADAVEKYGLQLASLSTETTAALDAIVPAYGATANPVDVTATVMSDPALFDRALAVLVDDDSVDAIVACFCVLVGDDVARVVASLARAADRSGKPVLAARTGADHLAPDAGAALRAAGIPAYVTPERAVRALAALHQVSTATPVNVASDGPRIGVPADTSERGLKEFLAAQGITVPRSRLATSAAEAAAAVAHVGGRAVMKAVVPGLVHKTEAGAVVLNVTSASADEVYARLAALGGDVLVEEMVTGGVEALVGVVPSPLGTVLSVGVGGTLTEIVDDVALRVLPVGAADVEAMIDETRLGRLLAGARGAGPYDRNGLVNTVERLGRLVRHWPPTVELDLNPVAVLPAGQGVCVLDAALSGTGDPAPPSPSERMCERTSDRPDSAARWVRASDEKDQACHGRTV